MPIEPNWITRRCQRPGYSPDREVGAEIAVSELSHPSHPNVRFPGIPIEQTHQRISLGPAVLGGKFEHVAKQSIVDAAAAVLRHGISVQTECVIGPKLDPIFFFLHSRKREPIVPDDLVLIASDKAVVSFAP